jgi:hypothetical protein
MHARNSHGEYFLVWDRLYICIWIYCHISGLAWQIIMGSGFNDWIYWHFFIITVNYNSSHIELLLHNVYLTNLSRISNWSESLKLMNQLPCGPNIRHHVEQLIASIVTGMSLFSSLLPSNDSFVAICCSGNMITEPLLSNGRPLRLHCSGFQPSCHNMNMNMKL